MFGTLWFLIKIVVIGICGLFLLKEIGTVYYLLRAKSNKACDLMYFPIIGIFGVHFLRSKRSEGKMSWIFKRVSEHEGLGKKWIATNSPFHLKPIYVITDA